MKTHAKIPPKYENIFAIPDEMQQQNSVTATVNP
jgi:hypothetical protein